MRSLEQLRWRKLLNLFLLVVASAYCLLLGNGFGWILGAVFAGVFIHQVADYRGRAPSSDIVGIVSVWVVLSVLAVRVIYWSATHGAPPWVIALLVFVLSFPLHTFLLRVVKKRSGAASRSTWETMVCWLIAAGLFLIFVVLQPQTPALQALILLFAVEHFYQGAVRFPKDDDATVTAKMLVALGATVGLLCYGAEIFHLNPIFHVIVVKVVAGVIGIVFQAALHQEGRGIRIANDGLILRHEEDNFLSTLQQSYKSAMVNIQVWGLMAVVAFDLPARLVRSNMQGNVFEASLSLVGIMIAVILFVKERGQRGSSGVTLSGVWGIIVVFLTIAGTAFITLALTSGGATLDTLPNLDKLTMVDLFTQREAGFNALMLFLYEALFYAVLIGLMFIGSVIRDVLRHEEGSETTGELV